MKLLSNKQSGKIRRGFYENEEHLKKATALLLAFIMVFGAAPAAGFVCLSDFFDGFGIYAQAASERDLTFELINSDTEYEVSGWISSASGELTIPATYNGKPVTSIGLRAFDGCTGLSSVTIPNSVTSIDDAAFYGCTHLSDVYYGGDENDKAVMAVGYDNEKLNDATWHYTNKVVKIEILTPPNTVTYTYKNGTFDKAGLSIKAINSNGDTETITDTTKIDVSGFDANKKGEQKLTVKYGGCETNITVTVKYSFVQWLITIFLFGWIWY